MPRLSNSDIELIQRSSEHKNGKPDIRVYTDRIEIVFIQPDFPEKKPGQNSVFNQG